jgi:hypothetical protein
LTTTFIFTLSFKMFSKTALIACLAVAASAQTTSTTTTSVYYSNTTTSSTSSAVASPSATSPGFLSVMGKSWQFEGCASSPTDFSGFIQVDTSPAMTVERCMAAASAYAYAGIYGSICYASNVREVATSTVASGRCSFTCPGNPSQSCGGSSNGSPAPSKRAAAGALLSLYSAVAVIPTGNIYISIFTTIYINVCSTGLCTSTLTTSATLTGCGCATPSIPSVPKVTSVVACNACATPGLVTVTVPVGCPAVQTAVACTGAGCAVSTPVVPCNGVDCAAPATIKTVTVNACAPTSTAAVACATCPGGVAAATKTGMAVYTGAASPVTVGSSAVGFFGMVAAVFLL